MESKVDPKVFVKTCESNELGADVFASVLAETCPNPPKTQRLGYDLCEECALAYDAITSRFRSGT